LSHCRECLHLKNEYELLNELSHPNIIRPVAFYENQQLSGQNFCGMSLELATCDLFSLIEKLYPRTLDIRFLRGIFLDLANSLKYLHDHNIAHNDFKLENVFLFKGYTPKLADFGFANKLHAENDGYMVDEDQKQGNSLSKQQIAEWSNRNSKYLAPEILKMLEQ